MASILFTIGRMSDNKLKYIYLKKQEFFFFFSLRFWNLYQILSILEKKMSLIA